MKKYKLTLTEKQAEVVIKALDLYTRMGLGQLERVLEVAALEGQQWEGPTDYETAESAMVTLKKALTGFALNASYGIYSEKVRDTFRVAYDIMQVLRHSVAWAKQPEGGIETWFYTPLQTAQQPLPTVSAVEEDSV